MQAGGVETHHRQRPADPLNVHQNARLTTAGRWQAVRRRWPANPPRRSARYSAARPGPSSRGWPGIGQWAPLAWGIACRDRGGWPTSSGGIGDGDHQGAGQTLVFDAHQASPRDPAINHHDSAAPGRAAAAPGARPAPGKRGASAGGTSMSRPTRTAGSSARGCGPMSGPPPRARCWLARSRGTRPSGAASPRRSRTTAACTGRRSGPRRSGSCA